MPKGVLFWTPYRRAYVATQLADGISRMVIAVRLGVSYTQLQQAISRYRLDQPYAPEPGGSDAPPA